MEQLIKKTEKGHSNVMPKSWIDAIIDKSTGESLSSIIQKFNMYFFFLQLNTNEYYIYFCDAQLESFYLTH